eukprot:979415_1
MADYDLQSWMKKQNIYDNDLYSILSEQGIEDPTEDFQDYTQSQWDVLWRKGAVERAKELKDQKAKVRLEKKMKKLEKYWRKQSGIKVTSIKVKRKHTADETPVQNSAAAQNQALSDGAELKKYLKKNQCFSTDLVMVCVSMGICTEEDIEIIQSNAAFDEIYRQVRVQKTKDLKDNAARMRMEKQMTKFEKLWRRKTGVEKTSIKKNKPNKKKRQDPKSAMNEAMGSSGAILKSWMRKNNVWEIALYDELMANDITDPQQLADIDESTFDTLVRKVRVDRFGQLKDQKSRNRADKLLVKFEKKWRKASGIKKTSIK